MGSSHLRPKPGGRAGPEDSAQVMEIRSLRLERKGMEIKDTFIWTEVEIREFPWFPPETAL